MNYLELLIVRVLGSSGCHFTPTTSSCLLNSHLIPSSQILQWSLWLCEYFGVRLICSSPGSKTNEDCHTRWNIFGVHPENLFNWDIFHVLHLSGKLLEALNRALAAGWGTTSDYWRAGKPLRARLLEAFGSKVGAEQLFFLEWWLWLGEGCGDDAIGPSTL